VQKNIFKLLTSTGNMEEKFPWIKQKQLYERKFVPVASAACSMPPPQRTVSSMPPLRTGMKRAAPAQLQGRVFQLGTGGVEESYLVSNQSLVKQPRGGDGSTATLQQPFNTIESSYTSEVEQNHRSQTEDEVDFDTDEPVFMSQHPLQIPSSGHGESNNKSGQEWIYLNDDRLTWYHG
jgi:hypothetical protein